MSGIVTVLFDAGGVADADPAYRRSAELNVVVPEERHTLACVGGAAPSPRSETRTLRIDRQGLYGLPLSPSKLMAIG
ncbi:hypothetical protein [Methylobacterium komagatae]